MADDRDWVFVTSSLLEERLVKVKRFAPNQLGRVSSLYIVFFLTTLVALALASAVTLEGNKGSQPVQQLETAWRSSLIKDPIEAMIMLEKAHTHDYATESWLPLKVMGAIGFVILVLGTLWALAVKYYLVYNFCWGEYAELFRRRENARRFWVVVVLVGVIISFIGGLLANTAGILRH